jgi:putative hemolysin
MDLIWLELIIIVLLTFANGFFAASEIAIVSARRGRLEQRAEAGSRSARSALELAEEPNRFLATVQVGISLIGTFAAAFGGDALSDPLERLIAPYAGETYAHAIALAIVVLFLTYLSLIIGELVPKRLALQSAEQIAVFVAPIMQRISRLAGPVVWFLTVSTQAVLTLLGRAEHQEEQITEHDVLSLVREGTEAGTVEHSEQELIERVFDFTDRKAREIMTPRTELCAVAINAPVQEAAQLLLDRGLTRLPVYRESLDSVAGIVHARDLFAALQREAAEPSAPRLEELMREPVYVFEHQSVSDLLRRFRQARTHLAIVLDEYGQTAGLVTLEDVLEELTGDISDEYDKVDTLVIVRQDGSLLVDGRLPYADAERRLDFPPREEINDLPDFDTVAGLVLALLERIPTTGESVAFRDWRIEVVDMDGPRIDKLLVQPAPAGEQIRDEAALALGAVLPPPGAAAATSDGSRPSK